MLTDSALPKEKISLCIRILSCTQPQFEPQFELCLPDSEIWKLLVALKISTGYVTMQEKKETSVYKRPNFYSRNYKSCILQHFPFFFHRFSKMSFTQNRSEMPQIKPIFIPITKKRKKKDIEPFVCSHLHWCLCCIFHPFQRGQKQSSSNFWEVNWQAGCS